MTRIATPLCVLALVASACTTSTLPQPISYTVACNGSGVCSGTVPAVLDSGMMLGNVDSWRLGLCAWGAQTLFDGGAMQVTWNDFNSGQPFRNQQLDQVIPLSGQTCVSFPDFKVGAVAPVGDVSNVFVNASGVTVSGTDAGPITIYLTPHLTHN